jgi:hypothetical protein
MRMTFRSAGLAELGGFRGGAGLEGFSEAEQQARLWRHTVRHRCRTKNRRAPSPPPARGAAVARAARCQDPGPDDGVAAWFAPAIASAS